MVLRSITDIGAKRKDNQDNYWSCLLKADNKDVGVMCMCDGMGGLNNGQLASRIVVESVRDGIKSGIPFRELEDVIKQANKTVYELGQEESGAMGTTCTVVQCSEGKYEILHVGDSRCYKVSESGTYSVLTKDHSALAKYHITREQDEALWKKYRSLLTRCIGVKPEVIVDYYHGEYNRGDIFVVCSDGMWHYFEDTPVSTKDFDDLKGLVQRCIRAGETDNITGSVLFMD